MEKHNLSLVEFFALCCLVLFLYECLCTLIAICKKRADFADVAWGFGFFLIAWAAFFLAQFSAAGLLVNFLVTVWAFRLGIHIYLRNQRRKEDFRYRNWKSRWEIFSRVFLLQGAILFVIALPILWIHTHPQALSMTALYLGLPLWIVGFFLETMSDFQLTTFQNDPANQGKLLTTGLWSYVRHPNYLGEILQWWAIWIFAAFLPFGWIFFISPLLLTYLIIKVSGVAPLEEKMKKHPDFQNYSKHTPSLIPPTIINALLYTFTWSICIFYGAKGSFFIPFLAFLACYACQLILFFRLDRLSLLICIPLSIYSLLLGLAQEMLLIAANILIYSNQKPWPPLWLLSLYPLFALTLNSSLSLINRNLILPFFIGGIGSILAYSAGEKLGGVHLFVPLAYPALFISWGAFLTILTLLNRKMISLREKYIDPEIVQKTLTVFFDTKCPVCFREMEALKNRKQTGKVNYACPTSDQDLKNWTEKFSYQQAMEKIHAIDSEGKILTGIDALSALYARTDLPLIAIWLQAPGFRTLFRLAYAIWAKIRR